MKHESLIQQGTGSVKGLSHFTREVLTSAQLLIDHRSICPCVKLRPRVIRWLIQTIWSHKNTLNQAPFAHRRSEEAPCAWLKLDFVQQIKRKGSWGVRKVHPHWFLGFVVVWLAFVFRQWNAYTMSQVWFYWLSITSHPLNAEPHVTAAVPAQYVACFVALGRPQIEIKTTIVETFSLVQVSCRTRRYLRPRPSRLALRTETLTGATVWAATWRATRRARPAPGPATPRPRCPGLPQAQSSVTTGARSPGLPWRRRRLRSRLRRAPRITPTRSSFRRTADPRRSQTSETNKKQGTRAASVVSSTPHPRTCPGTGKLTDHWTVNKLRSVLTVARFMYLCQLSLCISLLINWNTSVQFVIRVFQGLGSFKVTWDPIQVRSLMAVPIVVSLLQTGQIWGLICRPIPLSNTLSVKGVTRPLLSSRTSINTTNLPVSKI